MVEVEDAAGFGADFGVGGEDGVDVDGGPTLGGAVEGIAPATADGVTVFFFAAGKGGAVPIGFEGDEAHGGVGREPDEGLAFGHAQNDGALAGADQVAGGEFRSFGKWLPFIDADELFGVALDFLDDGGADEADALEGFCFLGRIAFEKIKDAGLRREKCC